MLLLGNRVILCRASQPAALAREKAKAKASKAKAARAARAARHDPLPRVIDALPVKAFIVRSILVPIYWHRKIWHSRVNQVRLAASG